MVVQNSLMENRLLTLANNDFRIVAKGLRNPFRFAVHPVNGDLYIGDVGSEIAEEVFLFATVEDVSVNNYLLPDRRPPESLVFFGCSQLRLAVF